MNRNINRKPNSPRNTADADPHEPASSKPQCTSLHKSNERTDTGAAACCHSVARLAFAAEGHRPIAVRRARVVPRTAVRVSAAKSRRALVRQQRDMIVLRRLKQLPPGANLHFVRPATGCRLDAGARFA